jgi:hypothetical protein
MSILTESSIEEYNPGYNYIKQGNMEVQKPEVDEATTESLDLKEQSRMNLRDNFMGFVGDCLAVLSVMPGVPLALDLVQKTEETNLPAPLKFILGASLAVAPIASALHFFTRNEK